MPRASDCLPDSSVAYKILSNNYPSHFAYLQIILMFRKRMEALSGGLGGLVIDNDLEKPEVDRINIFHDFVKKKIQV